MAAVVERPRVMRFTATERVLHWVHAAAFTGMLATGVALYSPGLAGVLGSRGTVKDVHVAIAAAWISALLVVVALGDRRALGKTRRAVEMLDDDDLRWLRRGRAPQGRLNAGQKLHTVVQAAAAVLFVVSGSLLLAGERNTALRLNGTIALHDVLTIATSALVLAHLYLAVVHRTTRPALSGIVTGTVDAHWAASHHAKWHPGSAAPAERGALRRPLSWLLLLVAAGVAALAVVVL